ncbi:MAG TPA: hypothetical protein VIN08_15390 [Ohtaekwangia sp.]|uniref:hypothetical protein n=1 Tax=Ohtaekwangia sp. TaxID=2066019 RepID=UPI002F95E28F
MRKLYLSALLAFSLFNSYSQVDIQVNYYTGTPEINIPLIKITDRTLTHTIGVSYDASGVKINTIGGMVGTNWSLWAGGEIRRELRGIPDDYNSSVQKGWLHNTTSASIGTFNFPTDGQTMDCATEEVYYNFLLNFDQMDNEPDVFRFSAGSISGSFMFDNNATISNIRTVPYQEVKIIPYRADANSPIDYFEIIAADGTKYTFSKKETTTRKSEYGPRVYFNREAKQYETPITFTSAWKLASIQSAVGERIDFSYSEKTKSSSSSLPVYYPRANASNPIEWTDQLNMSETTTSQIISSISSPHQAATFATSDIPESADQVWLDNIVLNEITPTSSFFVKKITFYIDQYFTADSDGPPYFYRYFLKGIQTTDACSAYNYHSFNYYGVDSMGKIDLPKPGTIYHDIWGYYLTTMTSQYPTKLYVYPSSTGIQRITPFRRTGVSGEIILDGADRISSEINQSGSLSSINYPSGAHVSFTYQSHEFNNPVTGTVMKGAGLRIGSITLHDGITFQNDIVRTFEYKDAGGISSGKLLKMPVYWYISGCHYSPADGYTPYSSLSGLSTAEQWRRLIYQTKGNTNRDYESGVRVGYSMVTEKIGTGNGKTVYTYDVPNPLGTAANGDWHPTYVQVARTSSCPSLGVITKGYYLPPYPDQTPYDFARGLLTKVSHYAEGETNPVKETAYTYADKTISPTTIKGVIFEKVPYTSTNYFFTYGICSIASNKVKVLASSLEAVRDKATPSVYVSTLTSYTYGGTDHPFPTAVTVTNSDGAQTIQRSKYIKDYGYSTSASTDLQVQMIDKLYERGQYGTLVEQTSSFVPAGGTEKTAKGTLLMFDNFGTTTDPVILPKQTYALSGGAGITGFTQSSYSGAGSSRLFTRSNSYRLIASAQYGKKGDLIRLENSQRQLQSVHQDNLSGMKVATIVDAEPGEFIYSSFDHDTDFDFDLINFTVQDKDAVGRTGALGLEGIKSGTTKYLKKSFKGRPGSKYKFSAWYKPPVTTGTHSLSVVIKNTSNVQLLQQTLPYTITSLNWHYAEMTLNLDALSDTDIVAEVSFNGSYSSTADQSSIVDDLTLVPANADLIRATYSTAYGQTSLTASDGRITQYEFDARGFPKYERDHEGNIKQKTTYTQWLPSSSTGSPLVDLVSIVVPNSVVQNQQTTLTAVTNCVDVAAIQWKVAPQNNPNSGTYFSGSNEQPYTFTTAGTYIVSLKLTHPSYGSIESSRFVVVSAQFLTVSSCVTGATAIDVCTNTATESFSCTVPAPPVNIASTQFTVSDITGCDAGATYTYAWYKRPYQQSTETGTLVGTGSSVTVTNSLSYEVYCVVTSSCGKTGQSPVMRVYIYQSTPGCDSTQD